MPDYKRNLNILVALNRFLAKRYWPIAESPLHKHPAERWKDLCYVQVRRPPPVTIHCGSRRVRNQSFVAVAHKDPRMPGRWTHRPKKPRQIKEDSPKPLFERVTLQVGAL